MTRNISLDTVRAAATRIYPVAARTPLIRLDPVSRRAPEIFLKLEVFQPIGSFKIRGAHERRRQADRRPNWPTASGPSAPATRRRAWRWPRAKRASRASVLVMETAPAAKLSAIERLGATIVKATYEECWRAVESHRSDRMTGRLVHPFDDDDFISGNGTAALEILEDLPDVDAVIAPIGGGGLLAGLGVRAAGAAAGRAAVRRRTGNRGAAGRLAQGERAGALRRLDGVVRGRRRRPSRCCRRCGRCSRRS